MKRWGRLLGKGAWFVLLAVVPWLLAVLVTIAPWEAPMPASLPDPWDGPPPPPSWPAAVLRAAPPPEGRDALGEATVETGEGLVACDVSALFDDGVVVIRPSAPLPGRPAHAAWIEGGVLRTHVPPGSGEAEVWSQVDGLARVHWRDAAFLHTVDCDAEAVAGVAHVTGEVVGADGARVVSLPGTELVVLGCGGLGVAVDGGWFHAVIPARPCGLEVERRARGHVSRGAPFALAPVRNQWLTAALELPPEPVEPEAVPSPIPGEVERRATWERSRREAPAAGHGPLR